jgi:hypothetical protein
MNEQQALVASTAVGDAVTKDVVGGEHGRDLPMAQTPGM